MSCYNIMAVLLNQRSKSAIHFQEVLTKHGCAVKVRLGLHDVGEDFCSEEGLVILQLCAGDDKIAALEAELNTIEGIKAKTIKLES